MVKKILTEEDAGAEKMAEVHVLPVRRSRGRRCGRPALELPSASVYQLSDHRPRSGVGSIDLPNSREEVQAMFDELAHHLLMTVRVITSRLR